MPRFPHQTSALARLEELRGAALFLDMGTGKTRIILEDLARPGLQPALVLAPRAVLTHWENEARKWVPWLPVRRIEKRKDVKELYGYEPGMSLEKKPPLTLYRPDDPQAFIK